MTAVGYNSTRCPPLLTFSRHELATPWTYFTCTVNIFSTRSLQEAQTRIHLLRLTWPKPSGPWFIRSAGTYWWDVACVLLKENHSWSPDRHTECSLGVPGNRIPAEKVLRSTDFFLVPKPAGDTVMSSLVRQSVVNKVLRFSLEDHSSTLKLYVLSTTADSSGGFDVCVGTEFTFQQCSVCHKTQGATDAAVAFPVVPQRIQFWLWHSVTARSLQRDLNQARNDLSYSCVLPGIAEIHSTPFKIVLVSGMV